MSVILLEANISVDPMKALEGEWYVLIKAYKYIILRFILYCHILRVQAVLASFPQPGNEANAIPT